MGKQLNRGNYSNYNRGNFYLLLWLTLLTAVQCSQINLQIANCTNGIPQLKAVNCEKGAFDIITNETNFHILQKSEKYVVAGVLCKIVETTHSYYCGTYGHLHLAAPSHHNRPIAISYDECFNAYKSKVIVFRGVSLQVDVGNEEIRHNLFVNGSIYYSDGLHGLDPQCLGKGIQVGQKFIPYSFVDSEVTITVKKIMLTHTENGCFYKGDMLNAIGTSDFKYGLSCKWKDLAYGSARVVVLNDTDENIRLLTGFRTINILNGAIFEKINFGKSYDNERKIVFNSEQAIALLLKEKIEFKEILSGLFYHVTSIDEIFIWFTASSKIFFPWVHYTEVDYAIESRVLNSFHFYNDLINNHYNCMTDRLALSNIVTLHRSMVKRNLGELEIQISCRQQILNIANLQNIILPCFLNHFSIIINTTVYGITPKSRIMVNSSNLILADCNEHPTYLRIDQNTYVTNTNAGLKFIQVESLGEMADYTVQRFYTTVVGDTTYKSYNIVGIDNLHLINLAQGATEFHIHVERVWYLHWYDKVSGWVSTQWDKLLFYLAIIMGSAFVLLCGLSLFYLVCCSNVWGRNVKPDET